MLRKSILAISIAYTVFIAYISLIRLKNLPDLDISFADKIFHCGAYGLLTILWSFSFLVKFKFRIGKALFYAFFLAVIFGIILEVLQGTLTKYRGLDVYDAFANTLGAALALAVLWITKSFYIKKI